MTLPTDAIELCIHWAKLHPKGDERHNTARTAEHQLKALVAEITYRDYWYSRYMRLAQLAPEKAIEEHNDFTNRRN